MVKKLEECPKCGKWLKLSDYHMQCCDCGWQGYGQSMSMAEWQAYAAEVNRTVARRFGRSYLSIGETEDIIAERDALRAAMAEAVRALEPFADWCDHVSATGSRRLSDSEWPPASGMPDMGQLRVARLARLRALRQLAWGPIAIPKEQHGDRC